MKKIRKNNNGVEKEKDRNIHGKSELERKKNQKGKKLKRQALANKRFRRVERVVITSGARQRVGAKGRRKIRRTSELVALRGGNMKIQKKKKKWVGGTSL